MAIRRRTAKPVPLIISFIAAFIARQLTRLYLLNTGINPTLRLIFSFAVFVGVFAGLYWLLSNYTDL